MTHRNARGVAYRVLKHRETYEIMRAEDVGWTQNKLVLGKHSGRNAKRR